MLNTLQSTGLYLNWLDACAQPGYFLDVPASMCVYVRLYMSYFIGDLYSRGVKLTLFYLVFFLKESRTCSVYFLCMYAFVSNKLHLYDVSIPHQYTNMHLSCFYYYIIVKPDESPCNSILKNK